MITPQKTTEMPENSGISRVSYPKEPNLENINLTENLQCRLRTSISLEKFKLELHDSQPKQALVGGSLEMFILA